MFTPARIIPTGLDFGYFGQSAVGNILVYYSLFPDSTETLYPLLQESQISIAMMHFVELQQ